MNNYAIADNFSMLSKLMDIHGENSFKAKSYAAAAFTIEKLPMQLASTEPNKIFAIKGIGESVGQKILEQLATGKLKALDEYYAKTPAGVVEMLNIKGIGPKKIATIWKQMEIETIGELLYACNENRLTLFKGFGEKTQQSVKESIEFYMGTLGSYLYQQIETYALAVHKTFTKTFGKNAFAITGAFRRQLEVIDQLEWVTTVGKDELTAFFAKHQFDTVEDNANYMAFRGPENVTLGFHLSSEAYFFNQLFTTSCSEAFLEAFIQTTGWDTTKPFASEEAIFEEHNFDFVPPYLRETGATVALALHKKLPEVIQVNDIKGIVHSHSKWSDGTNSLEEMATACVEQGYEYLVISDHSKTAGYAQGLPVERVLAQHQQINELNKQYAPFKIFKSIESDILADGSLDYDNDILNTFDIVIASIHSNLKMTEEKAMMRLMNAISNPYTSILGHMTGRLLLSRNGYPVDHKTIIDACAKHHVAIELNAHPRRLDIDWRWIQYALEQNVLISINPDAHNTDGYQDCKYGVLAAQKAGLTKEQNLSSFSLATFEQFVQAQQLKRPSL